MKKFLLATALLALSIASASADEDGQAAAPVSPWTKGGSAGINLSQMTLSNWAAGGDPTLAADFNFNYSIDYNKGISLWQNRLELAYGLNHTESNGTRKTNDKIFFSSSYGCKMVQSLYISAIMKFNTQFAEGYDYSVNPVKQTSDLLAPGYLSAGLGIIWKPRPWFALTASPSTWRGTMVCVPSLRSIYGLEADQYLKQEFGGDVVIELKGDIIKDLSAYSRLNLFTNYLKNPQNVDVDWTLQLSLKINKWLSASFNMHVIYDDDIRIPQADGTSGPRLQIQEVAGLGLLVKF